VAGELLAHGLIRASFVPDAQTQEMRKPAAHAEAIGPVSSPATCCGSKRHSKTPTSNWTSVAHRFEWARVARAMIEALIAGETNPAKLASLADRRVKGVT